MKYRRKTICTLTVLQMMLTIHSFHWTNLPFQRQAYIDHRQAYIDDIQVNIGADVHHRPAQYEHSRLSLRLQAALSLRETADVIRETVLLSQIAGHYVKDIRHKGGYIGQTSMDLPCIHDNNLLLTDSSNSSVTPELDHHYSSS